MRLTHNFSPAWPRLLSMLVLAGVAGSTSGEAATVRLPEWLEEARHAQFANPPAETRAIVLHDEGVVEVRPDGRMLSTTRYAVRITTRDGRSAAAHGVGYAMKSDRIESAAAWLIRPSGEVRSYSRREFVDLASYDNELYSENRRLVLSVENEVEPGSVFAVEIRKSERTVEAQNIWTFQGTHPVVRSRCSLRLPPGWRVEGRMYNHPPVAPVVSGADTAWELQQVLPRPDEPLAPSLNTIAPMLAVTLFPPADAARRGVLQRAFASWADVSAYIAELADPPARVDPTIAARSAALVQGADAEWEKIQAIARFAQRVNYVSIQTRLGLGGGLTPHAASEVLRCNYGDCKDKTTLMRALLAAAGIESHMVAVLSADSPVIWEDWPSPAQFNHAIIAVRVSPAIESPAVVTDPRLGRLLFFDPTDTLTVLGDLPGHYQGSLALVNAGADGGLVRLPWLSPETSRLDRVITATITPAGAIAALVREDSLGQAAVEERALFLKQRAADFARTVAEWVTGGVRGAKVSATRPHNDDARGTFALEVEFTAPNFAQSMRGNLLVFKPVVLGRRSFTVLTAPERKLPVVIKSRVFAEEVVLNLPAGFRVSEIGESVKLEEAFGTYEATFTVAEGQLRFQRSLTLRPTIVPPENYLTARRFFESIVRVEQTPVVLERVRE